MATERRTDIGPPHYSRFLPPVIKENYGKWKYHDIVKPGVMVHVGESGDKMFTVRAGSPRLMSTKRIRTFGDLADKYCGGFLRFTSRHNVEFLLTDEANIDPLIADLAELGHPVGGIGNAISRTSIGVFMVFEIPAQIVLIPSLLGRAPKPPLIVS